MNKNFYYQLLSEQKELKAELSILEKRLRSAPGGTLKILKSHRHYLQYYHCDPQNMPDKPNGKYLRKNDFPLAVNLAQKSYDKQVASKVKERLNMINSALRCYEEHDPMAEYAKLSANRQSLIIPLELPDAEFISRWKASKITGENSYEITGNIHTENGEPVRSKSEKIIADKLKHAGIPYVYEPTLALNNHITVYPDFAVVNVRLRKEYYLEHFGMMDNPEYSARAVEKIEEYEKNGFWYGKNMLYTFETSDAMPDDRVLDEMIRTFLK